MILCNSNEDLAREEDYFRVLMSRQVEGLLVSPVGQRHELIARLVRQRFPIVLFDRGVPSLDVSSVMLDNEQAAFEAVEHLTGLGHRTIGMVAGPGKRSPDNERIAGYRRALAAAGIPEDGDLIANGLGTSSGAADAVERLLTLSPLPTALFSANNLMTIGTLAALNEAGLTVPGDVALVGFDDFSWADVFRPRLTTIAQPTHELGRTAAELLRT